MKTVVIHQPDFLPYLGFFHRLLKANEFIVLDHVVLSQGGWLNRDKIKTYDGYEKWITVPIEKSEGTKKINSAKIVKNNVFRKILKTIEQNYKSTSFFNEIYPELENIFLSIDNSLIDLNMKLINLILKWFEIDININFSSQLNVHSKKSQLVAELVHSVRGTHYLSGTGAKSYHDQVPFDDLNIKVIWQNFLHPKYDQKGKDFIPFLSCIDLLFNCGIENSKIILHNS